MAAVASRNPFEILNDDAPAVSAETSKPDEKSKADAPASKTSQRGRSGPASRSGRYYRRGGAAPRAEHGEAEDASTPREGEGERSGDKRGRGGRGRGRGRGERGRGGHGRIFDKHSATGKTDSEKKITQGWGGDDGEKELKAEEEGTKDAAAEPPVDDPWGATPTVGGGADDSWGAPPAGDTGDAPKEAAPAEPRRVREEEEDNTLTYDQYLEQLKEKSTVPKLENVRKPNDGDDGLLKGLVQVQKDEEDSYFSGKAKPQKQRNKEKSQKQVVEIDITFADRAPRGGRGGRGGERGFRGERGRGRGGRGRGRGEANGASVNVNDESAFPALAA